MRVSRTRGVRAVIQRIIVAPSLTHFGSFGGSFWEPFGHILNHILEFWGGMAQSSSKVIPSGASWETFLAIWSHAWTMLGPFGSHFGSKRAQREAYGSNLKPFWELSWMNLSVFSEGRFSRCFCPLFLRLWAPFSIGTRRSRSSGLERERIFAV